MNAIFDRFKFTLIVPTVDISGTGDITTAVWVDCKNFPITSFIAVRGTATDAFDKLQVNQATDSSGTGSKAVTSLALTSFAGFDTLGDVAILELDAEAMDIANSFTFASIVYSLGADTGANNFTCFACQGQARYAFRALNARVAADAATSMIKLMG